ncbi:protein of unknown function [Modestobacter italicus]|uniref:Uncharacterized protein n=1 Tax=Modestobacter italicus (strain DSM 44449 / CECT 9708 / BC 501) TaxID=2732864 RepID=I4ESH1_MODI5|nr:protein of unknown function [Modestobacter marinus]
MPLMTPDGGLGRSLGRRYGRSRAAAAPESSLDESESDAPVFPVWKVTAAGRRRPAEELCSSSTACTRPTATTRCWKA